MEKRVRVRFAPSPTGGLHLGGVRTVLYNYLFARKHGGDFILRIEDTDQNRFVAGAEEYIFETLQWCGMQPDESAAHGGPYGPYRQSERKQLYHQYAQNLIDKGYAYYAFDTAEELDAMRINMRTDANPSPQYDSTIRMQMRNSLTLNPGEVDALLHNQAPHVIRIKMPEHETVQFNDLIRGDVSFDTSSIDDKVLLKADGMPTYHLAVVVDDYLMKISHAFRGEEWLPSAPVHILLWRYLFGEEHMPEWAHFPLILGPSGKLSKRDGVKYGFPVFAMNWRDPNTGETIEGFREKGFLPEAFINLLAMLGWNDGTDQEIFTMEELIEKFHIEKVHKGGAKFDFEKAKWFNHQWIQRLPVHAYLDQVKEIFQNKGVQIPSEESLIKIVALVKDRCHLLTDFFDHASFFFVPPQQTDYSGIMNKWSDAKAQFFSTFAARFDQINEWHSSAIESAFKQLATEADIKPGELQLPLRLMLVGGRFGPPVFDIAELLGKAETMSRIQQGISQIRSTAASPGKS